MLLNMFPHELQPDAKGCGIACLKSLKIIAKYMENTVASMFDEYNSQTIENQNYAAHSKTKYCAVYQPYGFSYQSTMDTTRHPEARCCLLNDSQGLSPPRLFPCWALAPFSALQA